MAILATTFAILLVLAMLALSELSILTQSAFLRQLYAAQFQEEQKRLSDRLHARSAACYRSLHNNADEDDVAIDQDEMGDTHDDSTPQPIPGPPGPCSRFLHVGCLFRDDNNTGNSQNRPVRAARLLLKSLIKVLYGHAPFFIQAKATHPDLEEELINALIIATRQARQQHIPIRTARDFSRIELEDPLLQDVLYHMLTGTRARREESAQEEGYCSLLDFITFRDNAHLVSLWLAPRQILEAIFQEEDVVDKLCKMRHELASGLNSRSTPNTISLKEQTLRDSFASELPNDLDQNIVNFKVSTTKVRDW
jgi:hypothetical protein